MAVGMGYSWPGQDGGTQAAVGMPLALTQEDFLVQYLFQVFHPYLNMTRVKLTMESLLFLPTASKGWGKVIFSVCLQGEGVPTWGTYPLSGSGWGRGYPKVPTPSLSKVPTPPPGHDGWGVPQGTYAPCPKYLPPIQVRTWGRGYPKVPNPHPGQDEGYPKVPPSRTRYLSPIQGTYPRPGQDGVPTPPVQLRMGEGVPQDRTAYGVLDTLWSVCLLRSCFL